MEESSPSVGNRQSANRLPIPQSNLDEPEEEELEEENERQQQHQLVSLYLSGQTPDLEDLNKCETKKSFRSSAFTPIQPNQKSFFCSKPSADQLSYGSRNSISSPVSIISNDKRCKSRFAMERANSGLLRSNGAVPALFPSQMFAPSEDNKPGEGESVNNGGGINKPPFSQFYQQRQDS